MPYSVTRPQWVDSCIGCGGVAEVDKCGALSSAVITGSYSHHIALCGNYRAYSSQRRRLALNIKQVSREKRGKYLFHIIIFSQSAHKDTPYFTCQHEKICKISLRHSHFAKKKIYPWKTFSYLPAWKSQTSLWQLFSPKYTYEKHSIHKYGK